MYTKLIEMRRKNLCLIVILFLFVNCKDNVRKSANDFYPYSYYVSLVVKHNTSLNIIVIENSELHYILSSNNDVNSKSSYKSLICNAVKDNRYIEVSHKSFDSLKKYSLAKDSVIKSNHLNNVDSLLLLYFNKNNVQFRYLSDIKEKYIIYSLYKQKRLVKQDCETGLLCIEN